MQLLSLQENTDLALLEPFAQNLLPAIGVAPINFAILLSRENAFIPNNHGPAAVFTGRNNAFKITVVERVIFRLNRESLVTGTRGWTFRHRPRHQHAVHFQSKVIMQTTGGMLLYDKLQITAALRSLRRRFRSFFEIPLSAIFLEHGSPNFRAIPVLSSFLLSSSVLLSSSAVLVSLVLPEELVCARREPAAMPAYSR